MGYNNRGNAFEIAITNSNEVYKNLKIASIIKRPTPVKVLRTDKTGRIILQSVWEKKSTVDYDGVYQGRAVHFEAKSTEETTRFPLDNIKDHQFKHLDLVESMGAICFFLIEFSKSHEIFFVPFSVIKEYVTAAQNGGRKSIPRKVFDERAYPVKTTYRAPIDYIEVIDRILIKSDIQSPGA
ncbi:Holliday junction resolvase RecU [Bacillus sp. NPDC077411]|uniref:Holliday junction resolvase RecU n=1 Tax=Bacillus sp. NPDC077411 TaxID=3363947 RepID=UPI0037C6AD24